MFDLVQAIPANATKIEKQYTAGERIMSPFEPNDRFYILVRGKASVYNYGLSGEIMNIYNYESVSCFGEIELLGEQRYPCLLRLNRTATSLSFPNRTRCGG